MPPHTLCVCVNTQHSVMPVSSVDVTISAPHWPYMFSFPFIDWLVGGWGGEFVFLFWQIRSKVSSGHNCRQATHAQASPSLWWFRCMKDWLRGREACSSFYISLFL